jgi:hypothetical protein
VLLSLSAPRSITSTEADLPLPRLKLVRFRLCLGLFESELKLQGFNKIPMKTPIHDLPIPDAYAAAAAATGPD